MNILNGINRVEDGLDTVSALISGKKEYIWRQVINVGLLLVILVVTGCMDWMNPSIHFEKLLQIGFWTTIASKLISGICAYNIGINIFWDVNIKRNIILKEAIEQYNKLISYMQIDFEYFVLKVFNVEQKKKAYISKINQKIYKLNKFSRAKDRLLYSSTLAERQAEKEKNHYCIRRKELEMLKTDEYINANLEAISVRYNEVDPAIFQLEIDGAQKITGIKTRGNVNVGKIKSSTNVALSILGVSALTTAISFEISNEQLAEQMISFWNYIVKCVIDVATIIWQFVRGTYESRGIISKELTQPYIGRNQVLTKYVDWRQGKPNAASYEFLHKEEEVVEVSQEEYDKLFKKEGENANE